MSNVKCSSKCTSCLTTVCNGHPETEAVSPTQTACFPFPQTGLLRLRGKTEDGVCSNPSAWLTITHRRGRNLTTWWTVSLLDNNKKSHLTGSFGAKRLCSTIQQARESVWTVDSNSRNLLFKFSFPWTAHLKPQVFIQTRKRKDGKPNWLLFLCM